MSAPAGQKTYWHLAEARRLPTTYEIATTRLHYYVGRGFEVAVPLSSWYERYQRGSPLACDDWDRFRDPRETTYARYTALQQAREAHVDGLFHSIEEGDYDRRLPATWIDDLERLLPPLRHLYHGLQMLAAYLGQMAPSGRLTIAAAFQAADEMRRVHRVAYRMAELRLLRPGFGAGSRDLWQAHPAWQPTRKLVEELLVTYDWAEAFTALNLCAKPVLDTLLMVEAANIARARGDYILREIFFSLHEDCLWHRAWSAQLVELALGARPENRAVLDGWTRRWLPAAQEAAAALAPLLGDGGAAAGAESGRRAEAYLREIGVRS